jgi:hypothetical protein
VGPRFGPDVMARRKNPSSLRESNLGFPVRSLVTILIELPQLWRDEECMQNSSGKTGRNWATKHRWDVHVGIDLVETWRECGMSSKGSG